jgi:hypothetical protein
MSAPFYDQGGIDQVNRILAADSQPQIIIFASRQIFIKYADGIKQCPSDHHRGRADQTQSQGSLKNHSGWFPVPIFGIHPDTVSHPDFFGLVDKRIRI